MWYRKRGYSEFVYDEVYMSYEAPVPHYLGYII
jgi:hypothetical protein